MAWYPDPTIRTCRTTSWRYPIYEKAGMVRSALEMANMGKNVVRVPLWADRILDEIERSAHYPHNMPYSVKVLIARLMRRAQDDLIFRECLMDDPATVIRFNMLS